jgi:hypothetical protein
VILSHNGFCLFQCGGPPLNLKIFISSNAFDNSSFFYEQPKFTWLVRVVIAIKVRSEIDAASRDPVAVGGTCKQRAMLNIRGRRFTYADLIEIAALARTGLIREPA